MNTPLLNDYSTVLHPPKPIIYLGPSASRAEVQRSLPEATILPPIARDDLYRARERGGCIFLIIDGVFLHKLAISPREIIDVIGYGAVVLGASSMGAVRAAECWPVGMRGIGLVYRLYRMGVLDSDDEVAVTMDPDQEFSAVSVALVNIRYALSRAVRARLIHRDGARQIVERAERLFFAERRWPTILKEVQDCQAQSSLLRLCQTTDLKRKDALHAVEQLKRLLCLDPSLVVAHARCGAHEFVRPERYRGHDRYLGSSPESLRSQLTIWLFGSGRYQKYVWALVVDEPELRGVPTGSDRAAVLRDQLTLALARILGDIGSFAERVWSELEFLEELDAEVMRWHAVHEAATVAQACRIAPCPRIAARVREEVAIAHGVRDWRMLQNNTLDGRLFGAIPLKWIAYACELLTLARTFCSHFGREDKR